MIMKQYFFVPALMLLCVVASSTAFAECPVQIMGKYHIEILQQQWDLCQGGDCDGCLFDNYPDLFPDHDNPFDTEDGGNCNGMRQTSYGLFSTKRYTLSLSHRDPSYMNFHICGTVAMLQTLLETCNQRLGVDEMCYYFDDPDWITVPGAYLVGSAIILDQDIEYHINFGQLGYPPGVGEGDWDILRDHIVSALYQGAEGWLAVYLGAISYMNDAHDYGVITAKPAGGKFIGPYDYDWGEKVMAHALHAWQCWEYGMWEFDLWSEVGMACIPFVVDLTPSFFYEIAWEYSDLIFLPVEAEATTWGGLKAQYR